MIEKRLVIKNVFLLKNGVFLKIICLMIATQNNDCFFIPNKSMIEINISGFYKKRQKIGGLNKDEYEKMKFYIKLACNVDVFSEKIESKSIYILLDEENIGIRCSFHPVLNGEMLTIRIIRESLFAPNLPPYITETIEKRKGITIIVGDVCSGKTTFFYSLILSLLNLHRVTLEDPVEMEIGGILQSDISSFQNYEEGIKSLLRHAPDLIGIGEIRTKEVLDSAINASLTGRSILCTMHAQSIEDFLIRLKKMNCMFYKETIKNVIFMKNFQSNLYTLQYNQDSLNLNKTELLK